jgi:hypothetical protein
MIPSIVEFHSPARFLSAQQQTLNKSKGATRYNLQLRRIVVPRNLPRDGLVPKQAPDSSVA